MANSKRNAPSKGDGEDVYCYAKKLDEMGSLVDGMRGVCKPLAEDMLESYVKAYGYYRKIVGILDSEGLMIEVEKGGENNRHIERIKNPAFDMWRNCTNQMADLANKIKRFVKDDEGVAEDDFDSF